MQLLEQHWNLYGEGESQEVRTAEEFIRGTATTFKQIPIEYIWSRNLDMYSAVLCKIPGIAASQPEYKLFVKELVNRERIVFE